MASFAVAALLPPGNIERIINDIQDRLFRERGLASAEALPVFAALAAIPPGFEERAFERLVAPRRRSFRVELGGAEAMGRAVVLEASADRHALAGLAELRSALEGAASGPVAASPFPPGLRFWLAEAASEAEAADAARLLEARDRPAIAFSSFDYAILEVEAADGAPWWHELRWTIRAQMRARKG